MLQAPIIKGNRMAWLSRATDHRYLAMDKWEIPAGSIILEEMLGEGCFGEVHRGVVKGPLPSTHMMKSAICKTVALKFLKRMYNPCMIYSLFFFVITFVCFSLLMS